MPRSVINYDPFVPPAETVDPREFAERVDLLRRLQRTYFQTRDPQVLQKAKKMEQEVDDRCRAILQKDRALF